MNINDKKDALLFEIIEIYEGIIKTFLKTYKTNDGKMKQKLNINCPVILLYLFSILIYLICFIPYIFCTNLIYLFSILFGTLLFVLVIIYEQRIPNKKIRIKKGVDYKDTIYFDTFCEKVEKYCPEKLEFLIKYINFLTSEKTKVNIFINIFSMSFIIAFVVNVLTGNIGKVGDSSFFPNLMRNLAVGFIGIVLFNIVRNISSHKKIKLLRIKKYIKYELLCREIEKINNSPPAL